MPLTDEQDAGLHFTVQDELEGPFTPGPLPTPIGEDGLPRHDVEPHNQGAAPPFAYDTVICVEDDRTYVEMWSDEVEEVRDRIADLRRDYRRHLAVRDRYDEKGLECVRREFAPSAVKPWYGIFCATEDETPDEMRPTPVLVPVRPIRPRCEHYRRQVFANQSRRPGEFGHMQVHRCCTAKKSLDGAFLGLNDEAVYACDLRSPPDPKSMKVQDLIDVDKLRRRAHLKEIPLFGAPGEERDLADDPYDGGIGGIFERQRRGG